MGRIRHEAPGTLASVRRLLRQRGQFLLDDAPAAQERLVALISIGPVAHGANRYEPVGHRANSVEWIGVTVRANYHASCRGVGGAESARFLPARGRTSGPPRPHASVAPVSSEYRSMRAELPAQVVELVDAFRTRSRRSSSCTCSPTPTSLNPSSWTPRPPTAWSAPIGGSWTALVPKAPSSPAPATCLRPTWKRRPPSWAWPGNGSASTTVRYRPCPCSSCASRRWTWPAA